MPVEIAEEEEEVCEFNQPAVLVAPNLELVWVSPNQPPDDKRLFSSWAFRKELFLEAVVFHRPFFKQDISGIDPEIYEPARFAFSDAFIQWNRKAIRWAQINGDCEHYYRDELKLGFNLEAYNRTGEFLFYAIGTGEKYNRIAKFEFLIETKEQIDQRAVNWTYDTLTHQSAYALFDMGLRDDLIKGEGIDIENMTYAGLQTIASLHSTDLDFSSQDCPLCMEQVETYANFVAKCGHSVCCDCIKSLVRSHQPICRDDWKCYNLDKTGEYTPDDIQDLLDNEDFDELCKIIDVEKFTDSIVSNYGYRELFGGDSGNDCGDDEWFYSVEDFAIFNEANLTYEIF